MLKFSYRNSKLNKLAVYKGLRKNQVLSFDLPAGYSCPAANKCKSFSDKHTGKITDSKNIEYRCYAANTEAYAPTARRMRWHNFDSLKYLSTEGMINLIEKSLPANVRIIRIHSSGDFFNSDYFHAWVNIAVAHPEIIFFGYTKIIGYARYVKELNLSNFKLTYSNGGKDDSRLKDESAVFIVKSKEEADKQGLYLACENHPADDFDCVMNGIIFAIKLHGTQPKRINATR